MPLSKSDAPVRIATDDPTPATPSTASENKGARNDAIDAVAGAPAGMRQAAEDLPEGDAVKDAIKESLLATDAQTEARAKVKVIDDSTTGAEDTPSGFALKKVAGIADDVERGNEYARLKSAKRHGAVPASAKDLK